VRVVPIVPGHLGNRAPDQDRRVLVDSSNLVILARPLGAEQIAVRDRHLSVALAKVVLTLHARVILFNVFGLVAIALGG
jgi:hypothetical protein